MLTLLAVLVMLMVIFGFSAENAVLSSERSGSITMRILDAASRWFHIKISQSAARGWQEILEMAALGVVSRMDGDMAELEAQRAFLLQYGKIFLCPAEVCTVSSTKIRRNRKNHADFSCYLPQKVVQYYHTYHFIKGRRIL